MKGTKGRGITGTLGRKSIIIGLILLIVILIISTIVLLKEAMKEENVEQIIYTEKSNLDYRVYLKENDFYAQEYLGKDKQYIASLIDYVWAKFKYELNSTETDKEYEYTYNIIAEVNVEDVSNGNSIYKFKEDLVQEKTETFNSNKKLEISETIKIDYNKYNSIIKKFVEIYKLDDIDSILTIKMFVDVEGVTTNVTPVATLHIPLTTRTIAIDLQTNTVNATDTSVYKEIANRNHLYIAILFSILIVMLIIELFIFTRNTKDIISIYNNKIKKILASYDSYIQKTDNEFNFKGYQQIEMQTFEDLLQIRDTISQPILMKEKEKDKEVDFFIPSKANVVYIYKLKIEDFEQD